MRRDTSDQEEHEVVAKCDTDNRLLEKIADVYSWLDEQVRRDNRLCGTCRRCGKCCDFDGFDHRLFVTPPEVLYLVASIRGENIKRMPTSRCPYNLDGKCSIYAYRFAGCRIFCCNGDADFQSRLSGSVLEKLKSICTEFQISYRYTDLATALNGFAGV